jgi:peptidoglycan/xylan/chitin deacetylase (PgdA/CDA1 family)
VPELDAGVVDAFVHGGARATFFLSGLWAQARPSDAASLAAMPSVEIGNGGYSSEYLSNLPASVLRERTKRAQAAIVKATGRTPTLVRIAQLGYGPKATATLAGLELQPVAGGIDLTAAKSLVSAKAIATHAAESVQPGSIIVIPADGSDPRAAAVLRELLVELKRRGFAVVGVSELLSGAQ